MSNPLFVNVDRMSSYSFTIERDVVVRAADGTTSTMTVYETVHNVTVIHAPVETTFMDARRYALALRRSGVVGDHMIVQRPTMAQEPADEHPPGDGPQDRRPG